VLGSSKKALEQEAINSRASNKVSEKKIRFCEGTL